MSREDDRERARWQEKRPEPEEPQDFPDDDVLGPSRSPLQESRDYSFLPLEDDVDDQRDLRVDREPPVAAPAPRTGPGGMSEQAALALVILFFAIGGLALIVTGALLGGFAGALLIVVGLATAAGAGFGFWRGRAA